MLLKQGILREQWHLLLLAVSFFTRIPVKLKVDVTANMLNQASRYFALVGVFIGVGSALVFYLAASVMPVELALLIAMATSVFLTGAFHEDGWADVWDGFGGGWTVENKLNIMKDSRLGTYGAAALFFILMIKYQTLLALLNTSMVGDNVISAVLPSEVMSMLSIFLLGHCLSRVLATSLIADMPYVSEDATSKVKPLAQDLSNSSYLTLLVTGAVIIVFTLSFSIAWKLIAILFITRWCLKRWFTQQLGGYTGDCLGAAQQLSEVVIYLSLLSLSVVAS
ncbi:adenosylcobinamide-GDP ribazoletransferase [Colwellia sp. M166]|uniref:adenosylcobinamide-GDP ribazoletransferase n=1 Tax=Colwellia sp. M166 TaxID=2583805 RepID=UPI00211F2B0E|nr:adenosylcobinamide-GDP ribazoletransferase [Colwellia sp. M166]UUO24393.1 adenosylcobinamide-GDP ribazoletransferase [Colwellia sp. M166]|tara:strand:+ start:13992 stop:14831 length:840 start_codon:yes stop_codon:yes gene_type:complete